MQSEILAERAVGLDAEGRDSDESGVFAGVERDEHIVVSLTPVEGRSGR
ncbi:hypothetical protein [Microbacterium sp. CFBP9034]|nr:hypothetical protein [Microbacterium sp. CFBP9034]MDY0910672.1 hypothetical protein [Microbacterium sp. CFBP9034]